VLACWGGTHHLALCATIRARGTGVGLGWPASWKSRSAATTLQAAGALAADKAIESAGFSASTAAKATTAFRLRPLEAGCSRRARPPGSSSVIGVDLPADAPTTTFRRLPPNLAPKRRPMGWQRSDWDGQIQRASEPGP